MRAIRNPQMELGEIRIEEIELDMKSRDDIPALLLGLQHLYSDETFRVRLFALMDEYMLPGIDRTVGRPGMEMWRILVMGVARRAPVSSMTVSGRSTVTWESSIQNCGSGSQLGSRCCSGVAGSGRAGRCRFSGLTTMRAARWSNACTIFPSS